MASDRLSPQPLPLTEYGTIDITGGVPPGLVHVDLPRLGPTCKRLRIEYGKALVGWDEVGRNVKRYPVLSGVVVRECDHARLMAAVEAKACKDRRVVERLPVLAALFTLNRRAKRCRDLAQTYYRRRMHGLAGEMKREKERIYRLKGQALHYLVQAGVLTGGVFHRFEGGAWAEVLRGGGYSFHRPCPPQGDVDVPKLAESVEAKPKQASEPTLAVAHEVVARFLNDKPVAAVYQWPPVVRWRIWDDDDDWPDDEDEF